MTADLDLADIDDTISETCRRRFIAESDGDVDAFIRYDEGLDILLRLRELARSHVRR